MIIKFTSVLAVFILSAYSSEIHQFMNEKELRKIFQTSRNEVPEYELATIYHTMHKRSVDESQIVRIQSNGKSVELYLHPTNGFLIGENTPVWTVTPDSLSPEGLKYRKVENAFADIGKAYQDIITDSAVIMQKLTNEDIKIYGKYHTDFVIQPVPSRLLNLLVRSAKWNQTNNDFKRTHSHIVYKRQDLSNNEMKNGIRLVERHQENHISNGRFKRQIPEIIYPELLVIMDYSLYDVLGKNYRSAILYLLSFWNAVDLRYRTMNNPKIRLNLSGFIISIKDGGTPYLEQHRRGEAEVDADGALMHMSEYFYKESRFPFAIYDMAVALTNLDMCNVDDKICDTSTLGYAFEAGACNRSSIDLNTEAVGIIEDNGGYSAILPATHEVAHLLGVPHDGVDDSHTCPGFDGFIMTSAVTFGQNSFFWSECSRNAFINFFGSDDAECLFNEPMKSEQLPRMLPGKIISLDEQCYKVYGTRACYYDERVCGRLECYIPRGNGACDGISAAAEGSDCGDEMHCIRGNCIAKNATTIPDLKPIIRPPRDPFRNRFRVQFLPNQSLIKDQSSVRNN